MSSTERTSIHELLEQGEDALKAGETDEINDSLDRLPIDVASLLPVDRGRWYRLRAFAHDATGRPVEALTALEAAREFWPESTELLARSVALHLTLNDPEKAIEQADLLLSKLDKQSLSQQLPDAPLFTPGRTEILSLLAQACRDTGKTHRAQESLEQAIASDSAQVEPYLTLARLHITMGDRAAAIATLQRGLAAAVTTDELAMTLDELQSRPTVSACMIVKNEAELLPECLESIASFVDEIVVVDTGSTDHTVAIAKEFGARIFHQPWEGDFSKHRNFSLDQARSEWLFVIDADERLEPEGLAALLDAMANPDARAIALGVFNYYRDHSHQRNFLPSVRFIRRDSGYRYEGIVHNQLQIPDSEPVLRVDAAIRHLGYDLSSEKMEQKFQRSKALLEKQLADDPNHAFALFNLAQLLRGHETRHNEFLPEIVRLADRAVALTDLKRQEQRHIHLMCLNHLAWGHFELGNFREAERFAQQAIAAKPDYLDPLLALAHCHAASKRYTDAEAAYLHYLDAQANYDPAREIDDIIVANLDSRVSAWYGLGLIAEINGRPERAIDWYQNAVTIAPDYLELSGRLGCLLAATDHVTDAEPHLKRQLEGRTPTLEAARCLGEIYRQDGRVRASLDIFTDAAERWPRELPVHLRAVELTAQLNLDLRSVTSAARAAGVPESHIRDAEARGCLAGNRPERAIELLHNLVTSEPTSARWNDLGMAQCGMGDSAAAVESFRQATTLPPDLPVAWRNLGATLASTRDYEGAIAAFDRYCRTEPSDRDAQLRMAEIMIVAGYLDAAISRFESLLTADPSDGEAWMGLAEAYLRAGALDSAKVGLTRALEINPEHPGARQRLAQIGPTVSA